MTLLSSVLLAAVALYLLAMRAAHGEPDYRTLRVESSPDEDGMEAGTPEGEVSTAALLAEGSASPRDDVLAR